MCKVVQTLTISVESLPIIWNIKIIKTSEIVKLNNNLQRQLCAFFNKVSELESCNIPEYACQGLSKLSFKSKNIMIARCQKGHTYIIISKILREYLNNINKQLTWLCPTKKHSFFSCNWSLNKYIWQKEKCI